MSNQNAVSGTDVKIIDSKNINDFVISDFVLDVPYCAFGTIKDEKGKVVQTMKQTKAEFDEKGAETLSKAQAERTKTYRLKFVNVPLKQIIDLHSKTTTLFKKVYNDTIYNETDKNLKTRDKVVEHDVVELLKKVARESKRKEKECEKAIAGMRSIGLSEEQIEQFRTVFMQS